MNTKPEQSPNTAADKTNPDATLLEAVALLTAAARITHPDPCGGPLDFADFLAAVLASVTANVGGVERLLAGRPGSWEADLVRQLVEGTVGSDEAYLLEHRTEPAVIHLNVARLVEEAEDLRTGALTTPYERECMAAEDLFGVLDDDEYDADAEQAELDAIRDRWTRRYQAFAEAFTAAVRVEAARVPGLRVPVTVEATTDPDARTDLGLPHPGYWGDPDPDPIVWRLWCAALDATPLPGRTAGDAPAAS
jgi:hypothetical protein